MLTLILAWGCSWFDLAIPTYGEAMNPTFGASDSDIKMPADDYCLYHCFNYAKSGGTSPLTEDYARRLQRKIYQLMKRHGKHEDADRIMQAGEYGYPDESDFIYFAEEAGFAFAVVSDIPTRVYGSQFGPVCLTVRRHYVKDGAGHPSPHFDVISYTAPAIPEYESLGVT